MPWFSLKLFILSPLFCLFHPVVMILHGLWEGEDLPVHQTKTGFCWTWNQQCWVGHFGPSCKGLVKHLTGLLGLISFCPGTIMKVSTGFLLNIPLPEADPIRVARVSYPMRVSEPSRYECPLMSRCCQPDKECFSFPVRGKGNELSESSSLAALAASSLLPAPSSRLLYQG